MRKYESDGHAVKPDPNVIKVGTVLRSVNADGSMSPFSDVVVIGIWTTKTGYMTTHETIEEGILAYCNTYYVSREKAESNVNVELARPYLYASSIGICFNHLTGVEKFSTSADRLLYIYNYKVVEMSTGEAANYCSAGTESYNQKVG